MFAGFCNSEDLWNLSVQPQGSIEPKLRKAWQFFTSDQRLSRNLFIASEDSQTTGSEGRNWQGRINHWANRENARGFALEYQITPSLVFHVFRLFTTRRSCRAFWLLRFVRVYRLRKLTTLGFIVFEWLERIELNRTTLYDPRIRLKSV